VVRIWKQEIHIEYLWGISLNVILERVRSGNNAKINISQVGCKTVKLSRCLTN
jgi:hypothetical protein